VKKAKTAYCQSMQFSAAADHANIADNLSLMDEKTALEMSGFFLI